MKQVTNRKITAMHSEFGENTAHKCKDCPNLRTINVGKKRYKCAAYGVSFSAASDWAKRWTACGLYGTQFEELHVRPLMERVIPTKRKEEPLDGQMTFLETEEKS